MMRFGRKGCYLDLSKMWSKKNLMPCMHGIGRFYTQFDLFDSFDEEHMMKGGHFCMTFVT